MKINADHNIENYHKGATLCWRKYINDETYNISKYYLRSLLKEAEMDDK